MAAGDTMQGRRIADDEDHFRPGDYWKIGGVWHCSTPNGHFGNLKAHDVIEHEDGTITVSPSILVSHPVQGAWHGFLERGVWREV